MQQAPSAGWSLAALIARGSSRAPRLEALSRQRLLDSRQPLQRNVIRRADVAGLGGRESTQFGGAGACNVRRDGTIFAGPSDACGRAREPLAASRELTCRAVLPTGVVSPIAEVSHLKVLRLLPLRVLLSAALVAAATQLHATNLYSGTMQLTATDASQLGRTARNNVASDWSVPKVYPGASSTASTFRYTTLTLDLGAFAAANGVVYAPYIQVSIDSTSVNTFFAAYATSYSATSQVTSYLGDPGASGNIFGVDPQLFRFLMPSTTQTLVILMNETVVGAGLNQPGTILVEAFSDSSFTNLAPVPEPASVALFGLGLAALLAVRRAKGVA